MTADETRIVVSRFYEVLWNEWNDEAVETTLAAEFTFRGSFGNETRGRAGWREYRDMVRRGSPDFHNEVVDLVCEDGRAAARLMCTGHHRGPLLGLTATGQPFRYPAAAFFAAQDGVLTGAWVLGDLDDLRTQLSQV